MYYAVTVGAWSGGPPEVISTDDLMTSFRRYTIVVTFIRMCVCALQESFILKTYIKHSVGTPVRVGVEGLTMSKRLQVSHPGPTPSSLGSAPCASQPLTVSYLKLLSVVLDVSFLCSRIKLLALFHV